MDGLDIDYELVTMSMEIDTISKHNLRNWIP